MNWEGERGTEREQGGKREEGKGRQGKKEGKEEKRKEGKTHLDDIYGVARGRTAETGDGRSDKVSLEAFFESRREVGFQPEGEEEESAHCFIKV